MSPKSGRRIQVVHKFCESKMDTLIFHAVVLRYVSGLAASVIVLLQNLSVSLLVKELQKSENSS